MLCKHTGARIKRPQDVAWDVLVTTKETFGSVEASF